MNAVSGTSTSSSFTDKLTLKVVLSRLLSLFTPGLGLKGSACTFFFLSLRTLVLA